MPQINNDTLLRYCITVFDGLAKTSKKRKIDGKMVTLWEGKLVEFFSSSGISNAFYGRVFQTLYEIGSLEMHKRGSRGVATQIVLHKRPEADDLDRVHGLGSNLTAPTMYDRLSQRVSGLEGRLEGINLEKVIANQEQRLRALEAKVK